MKKPFLLIAGEGYYPSSGTGDWIGCYETQKEAEEQVKFIEYHTYYTKGKKQGQIKETYTTYEVNGKYGVRKCDWYDVVDLRDWVE